MLRVIDEDKSEPDGYLYPASMFAPIDLPEVAERALMTTLNRALAVEQMDQVSVIVSEDLNFNVARAVDVLLQKQSAVAESFLGFAARCFNRGFELACVANDSHAFAAAASRSFDHDRQTDRSGVSAQDCERLILSVVARNNWNTRLSHQPSSRALQTHLANRVRRWPDERESRSFAGFGKVGVLGKETVSGMNGFGSGSPRSFDQFFYAEVGLFAGSRPDVNGFIGKAHVRCSSIRIGVNGNSRDPHRSTRAHHAKRDLSAIGDKDFCEVFQLCRGNRPRINRMRRIDADLIRENPSNPFDPWSIPSLMPEHSPFHCSFSRPVVSRRKQYRTHRWRLHCLLIHFVVRPYCDQ